MYRLRNVTGILSLLFVLLQSCGDAGKKKETKERENANGNSTEIRIANRGIDAEPRLLITDSVQVLYYDDPDGDSLRYSRYFRYAVTADTGTIKQLMSGFQKPFADQLQPRDCRSEGKMFLFAGEQEVKTVYFSTRCDTCCYLYFIKDGKFLYFHLDDTTRNIIRELKKESRKP
jgi:hypothetical protein